MGYAYILTHPGIPCVMWDHFFDWGEGLRKDIQELMRVRSESGIKANSKLVVKEAKQNLYAAVIDNVVAVKLGHDHWEPSGADWKHVRNGSGWAVWSR